MVLIFKCNATNFPVLKIQQKTIVSRKGKSTYIYYSYKVFLGFIAFFLKLSLNKLVKPINFFCEIHQLLSCVSYKVTKYYYPISLSPKCQLPKSCCCDNYYHIALWAPLLVLKGWFVMFVYVLHNIICVQIVIGYYYSKIYN